MSSPYRKFNTAYSPKIQENEKDLIISQLKSQVFELEQNEKNFNSLSLKVRSLQSEVNLVSEEKLRLEYELKQRSESSDKQIIDLRQSVENMQLELSDKIQTNKKLFSDNNNFYRLLEASKAELNDIIEDRNRIIDDNGDLRERLSKLESMQYQDRNTIATLKNQLDLTNRDLEKSCSNTQELNEVLKSAQNEKNSLMVKLEESKRECANLNALLKRKEDSLSFASKNVDDLNSSLQAFKSKSLDNERQISQLQVELNQLNNSLANEKNLRNSVEKSNAQMENILNEKDKENRKLFSDNTELKNQAERSNLENRLFGNEIEKLKNHIFVLTEQNQALSDELENFCSRDDQLKQQLDRKNRVYNLLGNNRHNLEASLGSLDKKKY